MRVGKQVLPLTSCSTQDGGICTLPDSILELTLLLGVQVSLSQGGADLSPHIPPTAIAAEATSCLGKAVEVALVGETESKTTGPIS